MQPRVASQLDRLECSVLRQVFPGHAGSPAEAVAPAARFPAGWVGGGGQSQHRMLARSEASLASRQLTFVLLAWLGGATVCFAQDVGRIDQVVQSFVSNGTF